ncbi:MAG: alpha-L-glutamate ligase-like protein [Bdellovibrionales bacterium]|nr:alpha-L-glutamate ligase-like protein [Bdellovibrionales bacterium]
MLKLIRELSKRGVMGVNQRNAQFISQYNPRKFYPLVDDKLRTKRLAQESGIAVPELYGVIEIQAEVNRLEGILKKHREFVIKPAHGSGGEGVTVITGRSKHLYRAIGGELYSPEEMAYYVSCILGGMFSLGGHPDQAMIEYRVNFHPVFEDVSYLGVPDIRIIVFLGVPVMSMVRLPTRLSDGKANLHQGAIGVGIDIATGRTLKGVWRNDVIQEHPDTGANITGISIPDWDRMLKLASQSYELTGLGYQGIDIVIDKDKGPLILELNARPGLNIQIANQTGLYHRLRAVEQKAVDITAVADRVAFAKEHFSSAIG